MASNNDKNMSLPGPSNGVVQNNKKVNKKANKKTKKKAKAAASMESTRGTVNTPVPYSDSEIRADSFIQNEELENVRYALMIENKWPYHFMISSDQRASACCRLFKLKGDDNPVVIQTATWYLDSILAIGTGGGDNLHLYATACIWIAQKLHRTAKTAQELVTSSNYAFTTRCLLKAATSIIFKLKCPGMPVHPQEFITYLSQWCDDENPGDIELAASFICTSGLILDRGCLGEYPSAMGAAAVWNALYLLKKSNLLRKLEDCPLYKVIQNKANLRTMCNVQRDAVLKLASHLHKYTAPLDILNSGTSTSNVAEKVVQQLIFLSFMSL